MGQAIGETVFEVFYLLFALCSGVSMLRKDRKSYAGWAVFLLGFGDAFHLVPRMYALWTDGTANHPAALGFGTAVTSVTMTVFYVLLYLSLKKRWEDAPGPGMDALVYLLAAARIGLCLFPQNRWLSPDAPLSWGIYRNIPFTALGLVFIVYAYRGAKKYRDVPLRWLWLAATLSFGFYLPVVLLSDFYPWVGALMLPKTVMYIWMVFMLRK